MPHIEFILPFPNREHIAAPSIPSYSFLPHCDERQLPFVVGGQSYLIFFSTLRAVTRYLQEKPDIRFCPQQQALRCQRYRLQWRAIRLPWLQGVHSASLHDGRETKTH